MPELVWVFGYGSLMWRPGFPVDRSEPARLDGWHRRLCIWSYHWRGTRSRPGLVLGLDRGGCCWGRALAVAAEREAETLSYLDGRELVSDVYERRRLPVVLACGDTVEAWTYVARPDHPQFARELDEETTLATIRAACGHGGRCLDYVVETVAHLRAMGIGEPELERLAQRLLEFPDQTRRGET
ncbi:hypothetical protein HRbin40_00169 [bacterium HR40]|nr:hypothetical protein HRbin40_00169 [bacterium HR40]